MAKVMTKEEILLQTCISQYEKTLALVDGVKAIAQQFDGKCYNKRFDTALESAGCYVSHASYDKNSITIKREDDDGAYDDYARNLVICNLDDFINDDKRINAEKLNTLIDKRAEQIKKVISDLTAQAEQVESIIDLINEKIFILNGLVDRTHLEILKIYKNKISCVTSRLPR